MPRSSLKLYRFIEDAWSDGLSDWCRAPRDGVESWILADNPGQARWFARKFAQDGIVGVRIFDADGAYDEVLRRGKSDKPAALKNSRQAFARVCCVGWDAAHWIDWNLFDLLMAMAVDLELYLPSPRLPADALQRDWIERIEQRLAELEESNRPISEREICAGSSFESANESLVAVLEKSGAGGGGEAAMPMLLVGREWTDEVALVCEKVRGWLAENSHSPFPIGIVGPDNSATAFAVAENLQKSGILVEVAGRPREPAPHQLIAELAVRYHRESHDVTELFELTQLLWLYQREEWPALAPESVQYVLDRAFRSAQSRNSRVLARALPHRKDATWSAVCAVIEALSRWDGSAAQSPKTLAVKWSAMMDGLKISGAFADQSELPTEDITPRGFLDWVADFHVAARQSRTAPEYQSCAPVVVTTFTNAAQQIWERLILLDSSDGHWAATAGNSTAISAKLRSARAKGAHMLSQHESRLIAEARFLDLLEQTRLPIIFAGVALDHSAAGDHAHPNEWVMRCILETTENGAPAEIWTASAQTAAAAPQPALDPAERDYIKSVHASRANPTIPFDQFQFNFNGSKIEPEPWPATDLDMAITRPATFALKRLFGAEPMANWSPTRGEKPAVGDRVHRWLEQILAPTRRAPGTDAAELARATEATRRELEGWFAGENLPLPIWWDTCLRKAAWATRRCLHEVRENLPGDHPEMERNLTVRVQTPMGQIPIKGRIDLIASDRPGLVGARVRMVDFKTGRGKTPIASLLVKGAGAQFAAYYLMARDAGAAEASISIVKPTSPMEIVFAAADEEALRTHFGLLANMWQVLKFGRLGPLVDEHGTCESLPLATSPIDPEILGIKASLILLAS